MKTSSENEENLVDRLRDKAEYQENGMLKDLLNEAADEIEALETEILSAYREAEYWRGNE